MSAPPDGCAGARERLRRLPDRARRAVAAAMAEVGDAVLARARASLATNGPSPPGEAPADPDGRLAGSLRAEVEDQTARLTVAATATGARPLEYGTRRTGARPFLRPALAGVRQEAGDKLRAAVARALAQDGGEA